MRHCLAAQPEFLMTQKQRAACAGRSPPHTADRARLTNAPNVAVVSTDVLSGLKPGDNRDTAMHSPATVSIA